MQVSDGGQPVRAKLSVVDGFRRDVVEQWAGQNLEPGSVVHTDGLGCFRGVEAAGCEHKPRVTGGGKADCEMPGLLWVNTILGNVKRSLDGAAPALRAQRRVGEAPCPQ